MTIGFAESENLELKKIWSARALKSVSAFANGSGGTIIVGIDDDGTLVGVDDPDNVCTSITSSISDNIRPNPIGMISLEIEEVDGKSIVKVFVGRGPNRPYYVKEKGLKEGGVFIRRGTSSVAAPEDYIMKMVRERSTESYEVLPSINQELTFETAERIFNECGLPLGRNQMESLDMVESGTFTNLAYMLSDQFPQGIKMAVYEDEYKSSFLDRSEATGCVLGQFQSAYEFVDKHNSKRSRIVGPRRMDSREYPEEAVREAIINAIAHRDYGINGDILISMYRDRMVVLSIGGLNTGIGLDDVMAGVSSRRNPNLAAVMYRLEMMETYGTGIPRIMGMYRDQPLKPRIEVTTNSFKVTLPKTLAEPLSEDALRVMESLGCREDIRRVDVESLLGVSKTRAMATVRELEDAGLLERYGSGRETHYRPTTFVRGRL